MAREVLDQLTLDLWELPSAAAEAESASSLQPATSADAPDAE